MNGFAKAEGQVAPVAEAVPTAKRNRIALVLQGGGALGAYQAGIYQAMHEHDFLPDWVVGTSIGAINAALIVGNPPAQRLERLRAFWDLVSRPGMADMRSTSDSVRRSLSWAATLETMTRGVAGFFSPRLFSGFAAGLPVAPEHASFYDTGPLVATLKRLIDFDYLNGDDKMRLTVNALKVANGELVRFDSACQVIGVEHIMASGALPPGLPPVRVEGELYWDGGLYSNTPIETILDDHAPTDTLCFMVDLWRADGPEPTTLDEVQTRAKDVVYASRSKRHIDNYRQAHTLRCMVRKLYDALSERSRREMGNEVREALGAESTLHIVRLVYPGHDWHMSAKDINFSEGSIEWRWEQGYRDATEAIRQAGWLAATQGHSSVVVHELARTAGLHPR